MRMGESCMVLDEVEGCTETIVCHWATVPLYTLGITCVPQYSMFLRNYSRGKSAQ